MKDVIIIALALFGLCCLISFTVVHISFFAIIYLLIGYCLGKAL